jgi:hypothetical protein
VSEADLDRRLDVVRDYVALIPPDELLQQTADLEALLRANDLDQDLRSDKEWTVGGTLTVVTLNLVDGRELALLPELVGRLGRIDVLLFQEGKQSEER